MGRTLSETPPDQLPQFRLAMDTWSLQLGWGANILAVQGCPLVLSKSGTPNHSTLPLMEFMPNIGTLRQTFSKLISRKLSDKSSADVYSRCWMNFTCDAVLAESPSFMNLGFSSFHASDELRSFRIPANRIRRDINGSNWIPPGHLID